jgi:DNA-binding response OmpR family regulator
VGVSPFGPNERINLSNAGVLLLDSNAEGLELLAQMFAGFGMHTPHRASTADEAQGVVRDRELNLVIVDSAVSDMDGYEFVKWLRRSSGSPNRYAPVILLTGHTKASQVAKGRDCGANLVVRKPVPPLVMMQRIIWVSRESRSFVEAPNYCGPDRRHKAMGPPVGTRGRRHDDLSVEIGEAKTPNLDQDDIDALFKPKKAVG